MDEDTERSQLWGERRVQQLRELLERVEADRAKDDPAARAIRSLLDDAAAEPSDAER
jgi:hypothetical protein